MGYALPALQRTHIKLKTYGGDWQELSAKLTVGRWKLQAEMLFSRVDAATTNSTVATVDANCPDQ